MTDKYIFRILVLVFEVESWKYILGELKVIVPPDYKVLVPTLKFTASACIIFHGIR
jgi:hypothetical protein